MPIAINDYGKAAAALRAARGERAAETGAGAGQSFAEMVKGALNDAVASGAGAEKASAAAVGQGADLHGVVTAVAEAEVTLQTAIAVRERIIEAYKDVLRMPI